MENLYIIAKKWRIENGYKNKGGVIVFFNSIVNGWVNELRDPKSWQPGCIAVDESGNQWMATGGNAYNGAAVWSKL